MTDNERLLLGSWIDAIGTDISAIAEIRNLAGINTINNKLVAIGEGLQAVGSLLIGTVTTDDPLNFAGNWIDGIGAATSSYGAYLQFLDEEDGEDNVRIEILGDSFQSIGSAISAYADHRIGEREYALGNVLQSLGAGLEAIGALFELNGQERIGQWIGTKGAIVQSMGSNYNAIVTTKEIMEEERGNL